MFNGNGITEHEENVVRIVKFIQVKKNRKMVQICYSKIIYFFSQKLLLVDFYQSLHPCAVSICLQQRVLLAFRYSHIYR